MWPTELEHLLSPSSGFGLGVARILQFSKPDCCVCIEGVFAVLAALRVSTALSALRVWRALSVLRLWSALSVFRAYCVQLSLR